MAEFPPNLDDGELYLPSDMFLNQKMATRFNPHQHHHHHRHLSYMDDLANHFTALSLLQQTQHNPPLKIPHNLERFKPPVGNHVVNPLRQPPSSYFGLHGGPEVGQSLNEYSRTRRPFLDGTKAPSPVCDIHFPKPTPTPSDRVLQRQANRLVLQQNRVLPCQGNGLGFRGSLPRESGGTGVFHPRIINTFTTGAGSDAKKKLSGRDKEEIQKSEQRNTMKRVGTSKREDCYYHLPPEMGLPRDWTY